MHPRIPLALYCAALLAGGGALATEPSVKPAASTPLPRHSVPPSADGNLVMGLCDGETTLELKDVKAGQKPTRDQALAATRELMSTWRAKNPQLSWDDAPAAGGVKLAQARDQTPPKPRSPPAVSPPRTQPTQQQPVGQKGESAASGASEVKQQAGAKVQSGHTYGAFSERDEAIWAASTEAYVKEGHRVFHDADAVGGTIAVSCDMCHPDAANTHPETYPKYQVQLGRVALLRDMINWCLENPVRAKPMADDDPRMRAMEAYIYAQRKGTKLEYGKK